MFKLPLFIPVLGQKVFKQVEICLEQLNWIKYSTLEIISLL